MGDGIIEAELQRLRTPRAAAVAGIVFAILMGTALVLLRLSIPGDPADSGDWLGSNRRAVQFALGLVPFAGIAFLWFIGVVRDRIGHLEDRFFGSVLFGSGLLFLAMSFVSAALAGGMLAAYENDPTGTVDHGTYAFTRQVMFRVTTVFGFRMAAVFMISLATISTRTRTMPRWLTVTTYLVALALLLTVGEHGWFQLLFPGWVFLISCYILVRNLGPQGGTPLEVDDAPESAGP